MLFLPRVSNAYRNRGRITNFSKFSTFMVVYSIFISIACTWLIMKPQLTLELQSSSRSGNACAVLEKPPDCPHWFAGGSKAFDGSCWCGSDSYCMCTPSLAIDTVLEMTDKEGGIEGIVLVKRKDNGKYALVGGFVDVGETVEDAVHREVDEETGLEVWDLRLLPKIYSDPTRDKRRHTVSVVFAARTQGKPMAGDDASAVEVLSLENIRILALKGPLASDGLHFDHSTIVLDYLEKFHSN